MENPFTRIRDPGQAIDKLRTDLPLISQVWFIGRKPSQSSKYYMVFGHGSHFETLSVQESLFQVWPLLCATLLVSGPALWVVIAAPSLWQRRPRQDLRVLFNNCCWFTTTLFLRQCKNLKIHLKMSVKYKNAGCSIDFLILNIRSIDPAAF